MRTRTLRSGGNKHAERASLALESGTLRARNAWARPAGSTGTFGGRTVARQRREPADRGLLSRGASAVGLGAVSALVRSGPRDVVPNSILTPPPEGAAPGSSR